MISRRSVLISLSTALPILARPKDSFAIQSQDENYEALLAQTRSDEEGLELARALRETEYRELGPTASELAARPKLGRRYSSKKEISKEAEDLILLFEITSEAVYTKKYRTPVWPGEQSGATIGIGYDLGYVDPVQFRMDWPSHLLSDDNFSILQQACGAKGLDASNIIFLVKHATIPYSDAVKQFRLFIPLVAGQTIAAFPGSEKLSASSFGALVSLVYNRGGAMNSSSTDPLDRRREMRNIREAIASNNISSIPDEIVSMSRIWTKPKERGLPIRRRLEAALFRKGMA